MKYSEAVLNLQERKGPKNRPKHTRKRIHQAKKNFLEKFKTASQFLKKQLRMSWPNPFQQHSKVFRYATVQDYEHYSY